MFTLTKPVHCDSVARAMAALAEPGTAGMAGQHSRHKAQEPLILSNYEQCEHVTSVQSHNYPVVCIIASPVTQSSQES